MIISIRVDERLIHGQVALVWTKEFNSTHVLIASDQVAADPIQQTALQMAVPTGIKLLIRSVKDAVAVANDPRAKNLRLFVLTRTIQDAATLVDQCGATEVNVANVGRMTNPKEGVVLRRLNPEIFVDDQEEAALEELIEGPAACFNQLVPTSRKVAMASLLKPAGQMTAEEGAR